LLPSVVAGSLRSTIGKAAQRDSSAATAQELLQMEVAGVFPQADGTLFLPAPQDCVFHPIQRPLRAAPQAIEEGECDWPVAGLSPVGLTEDQAPDDFKPLDRPALWPGDRYAAWLTSREFGFDDRFLRAPEVELRAYVQLDPDTGACDDEAFSRRLRCR
jgi:hypothetical protein